MIRRHHGGGHAPEQLRIPLLTGHQQHPLQGESPVQREMANRLSAGRQPGENIQKPVTTQQGLSLQSSPPEPLTHQIQQGRIRLPQQITDLPAALLLRILKRELILQIRQSSQDAIPLPIRIDAPLPIPIGTQLIAVMNLTTGPTDPHLGRRQMQFGITLPGCSQ